MIIGSMRFVWGATEIHASLDSGLLWHCYDGKGVRLQTVETFMAIAHPADSDTSPASGTPGHKAFHDAVRELHATVLVPPTIPQPLADQEY